MANFNTNDRIIGRYDGSNFVESVLTLSGAGGIEVSVDADKYTITGDSAAVSGALKTYIDTQDGAAVTSGQSYADGVAADAVASGQTYADGVGAAAVTSGQSYADGVAADAVASGQTYADGVGAAAVTSGASLFVNVSGDTMTGLLILSADPFADLGAATKQYVDSQVSAAAVQVQEDSVEVQHSAGILDFGHALDVTSGSGKATVAVDEAELTSVVFLTGDQTISGTKTFAAPVVLAAGSEPVVTGTGVAGEVRWADDYLYICVATDTWKRVALATF